MSLKLFFIGIANCFNCNGYDNIMTPPLELGQVSKRFNKRLKDANL